MSERDEVNDALRALLRPTVEPARWPAVEAALTVWLEALGAKGVRVGPDQAAEVLSPVLQRATSLDRVFGADLLLASAAVAGDDAAIRSVDEVIREETRRAVGQSHAATLDDVTQLVRERLLVATASGAPRLAEFAGEGPLRGWVRAVAVRVALNDARAGRREDAVSQVPEQPLADTDPELAVLRAQHRQAFRAAFEKAVASLTARERTVLRLSTLDRLSLAHIGAMYRRDASTISRWLEQTRRTLLEHTRRAMAETLSLSSAELESVMRIADSELNVSLVRLLQSSAPKP